MSTAMTAAEPSRQTQAPGRSNGAFERLAEPLRREIKVHCYRMLGSLHEAEDAVQETYLRAWRSFDAFEGGSFRAWLYRIATNVCLNAIASRKYIQRVLPDRRAPATTEMPDGTPATDVAWLEPYPDSDLEGIADDAPNPEARYTSREAVRLAFVAAIQELPPRQRAALILCDVLGWAAAEAATLLGGSTASINSALQRGRETLAKRYPDGRPAVAPRLDAAQQKLLDRYLRAWEGLDLDSFVSLLKEDATLHHAAFAAMVCRAPSYPRLLRMGMDVVWRLSSGADGRQPSAVFCGVFPPRVRGTLGRALAPGAIA